MKLAIYSPFLNHHQVALADELYRLLGNNFVYVATKKIDRFQLKGGTDYSNRPYCLRSADSTKQYEKSITLLKEADVALISGGELEYEVPRAKTNKLTFEVSERWLKRGWINLFSPTIFKSFIAYWRYFHLKPVYKLCCSAFAARDHYRLGMYRNRCFKWGYFTKIENNERGTLENSSRKTDIVSLMWCARFLKLKHPELVVRLAKRLKDAGYNFVLDMYGAGEELENTKALSQNLDVANVVKFHGALPNDEILEQMRQHEIFLFTSDANEGWGAVANEAMSSACVLVGSDAIGSIPYLVRDGENGCIFRSMDVEDLYQKVKWLLDNPEERKKLSINAYSDMSKVWSPAAAARNLLTLISDIQAGKKSSVLDGPGSKATPVITP